MWSEVEGKNSFDRRINSGRFRCLGISVTAAGDYGFESPLIQKGRIPETD